MYKRGGNWYSDFIFNSERYTKSWGPVNKTVAKENDRKYRTEVADNKHRKKAKRILFETFAEKYLEYAKLNKKLSSYKRNKTSINMLKPHFAGKLIENIHPFMVERYKKDRKAADTAPATINRDIDALRNMMKKAVEWAFLPYSQLSGVKHLKENNEKMWVLTLEEEQTLLAACDARPQRKKYLQDLVVFALYSGMRQAEIFGLKKDKVNMRQRYIMVTDTKNHENRKVPINDTLMEVLKRRMKDKSSDYVFSNIEGKKITVLTNAYWTAIEKAGLIIWEGKKKIRFRFHDLRHTFGSRLGMAFADTKTIMEIMGHKTYEMAMRYQHPNPEHKLSIMKTLDQVPSESTTAIKELTKNNLKLAI